MILAGMFAVVLFAALVLGDWLYFSSRSAQAGRYGCRIGGGEDGKPWPPMPELARHFGAGDGLRLRHGAAQLFPEAQLILLRSHHGTLPRRFRTAWPMKAALHCAPAADGSTTVIYSKRIPWSSAILTVAWFLLVGLGTLAFALMYFSGGGLASLSAFLMGLGILGIGLLVLAFGLVTIAFAYRLENHRLTQAYDELRQTLSGT
jgi:hypothetical protein